MTFKDYDGTAAFVREYIQAHTNGRIDSVSRLFAAYVQHSLSLKFPGEHVKEFTLDDSRRVLNKLAYLYKKVDMVFFQDILDMMEFFEDVMGGVTFKLED